MPTLRDRAGGREANLGEFWTSWFAAFPDTAVTMDDALVDGDRVAGRFTYKATFTGSFMGLPPTGRSVAMHTLDIWRVVDGMAVEHWDQIDGQAFFAQLTGEADGQLTKDRTDSRRRSGAGTGTRAAATQGSTQTP